MAGILDSKSRIMDVIITQQGKRQMASGKLRAEFVSFSDSKAFYEYDPVSGSTDATARIYFEAFSQERDMITLETDDSGMLLGAMASGSALTIVGDEIFASEPVEVTYEDLNRFVYATGSYFSSLADGILSSSLDNFSNLQLIGSRTGEDADVNSFDISNNRIHFRITPARPFNTVNTAQVLQDAKLNVDSLSPFFVDKRLSQIDNFKFLPPLTREKDLLTDPPEARKARKSLMKLLESDITSGDASVLEIVRLVALTSNYGYRDLAGGIGYSYSTLKAEIGSLPDTPVDDVNSPWNQGSDNEVTGEAENNVGNEVILKEYHEIDFTSTSRSNRIVMQMFESGDNKFKKLDVIDFGEHYDESAPNRPMKRVFFVGKIYMDSFDMPTFVNIFTMVLD